MINIIAYKSIKMSFFDNIDFMKEIPKGWDPEESYDDVSK